MNNFVSLGNVFENVIGLVAATAKHLEGLTGYETLRGDSTREEMLARTLAKERTELATELRDYLSLTPRSVKWTWLQYTSDANSSTLLANLERTQSVSEAVDSLDSIDRAVSEVFVLCGRQDHPEEATEACEWAAKRLQRELERRASTVRSAEDI